MEKRTSYYFLCTAIRYPALFFFLFVTTFVSCAHEPKGMRLEASDDFILKTKSSSLPALRDETIAVPEKDKKEIKVGEKLDYAFNCFGIPAVRMNIEVKEITEIGDSSYYHIIARAQPRALFSFFYNVRYIVETYFDTKTHVPLKFYKRKIRGRKIIEETISFDYTHNTALWEYTGQESKIIPLTQGTQDLLSAFYYFRLMDITPQNCYPLNIIYNGKMWNVTLKVGKPQRMNLAGRRAIKTFTVEPNTDLSKYVTGEQKMVIYFSAGQTRIPVLFKIHSKISPLIGVIRRIPQE